MTESIQNRLKRVRPPRVRITHEVETPGGKVEEELPFIVGILSDLRGDRLGDDAVPLAQRPVHDIDRDSIDEVMRKIAPGVAIDRSLPELDGLGEADAFLRFHSMADFAPLSVAQALPTLRKALRQRAELCWLRERNQGSAAIDQRVAQIDALLSLRLSAILRQEAFRKLEASWRGLHHLVSRTETGPLLRLKVLDVTKSELCKDVDGAAGSGQNVLATMLHDAESGVDGGFPYGLLVGDYDIGGSGADLAFLGKMAEVVAGTNTHFIAAASSRAFGLDIFDALPRELDSVLQAGGLASWRDWRAQDVSRNVTLALPRVLLRLPHEGSERTDSLWGNAAWVLAERITHAFALYGWPAAIRGAEGGGLVEGFPLCGAALDAGAPHPVCPTEVAISDRHDKELARLGFMPLYYIEGTSSAAFLGGQAGRALTSRSFSDADANANAGLSTTLPYMLAASRFAHYLKVIMRKKAGMTRAGIESRLNDWIAHYVLQDDNAPQDVKAAYPLRAANVMVTEALGEPDRHTATVFIKPHFQLDELPTSIRLVIPLPA